MRKSRFLLLAILCLGIIGLVWIAGITSPAIAKDSAQGTTPTPLATPMGQGGSPHTSGDCLGCHGNQNMVGEFPDGSTMPLSIEPAEHQGSFHTQQGIGCVFCHKEQETYPHQKSSQNSCSVCHWQMTGQSSPDSLVFEMNYEDPRALALEINSACQKCHKEISSEMTDSAHTKIFEEGNRYAPVCVDCHGSHNITPVDHQKAPQICSKCHLAEYSTYQTSVHGAALADDANPDVPTCDDCHGSHVVEGPSNLDFRANSIELCGNCHADESIMSKYGISTDVFDTYLEDYHGRTVDFFRRTDVTQITKATCYDCHGVHNILSPENPSSKVYPENLQKTCQQCHQDASITFPQAWLSHKEPSMTVLPVMYLLNMTCLVSTTVIIVLFIIYIILDARRRISKNMSVRVRSEK